MSEYLSVEGFGDTRDAALEHADAQAKQFFGDVKELTREIGRADARSHYFSGCVGLWCICVEYRPSAQT